MEIVSQLGERELLRRLAKWMRIGHDNAGGYGVGDDCAILPAGDTKTILTTDLLVEGVHFLRDAATDWMMVGTRAACANISDLAAAGARPRALMISMSLPPDFPIAHLELFYQGFSTIANANQAEIVGGDTTRGRELTFSITAIGEKPDTWADCLRSDTRAGDHLYLTGPLGGSRAGLELLLQKDRLLNFSDEDRGLLVKRHFEAPTRIALATCLASRTSRLAMIDISDGLYNEASLMAAASGVQLQIWMDQLPLDPAVERYCQARNISDAQHFALFSGEEYELLIASPLDLESLSDHLQSCDVDGQLIRVGTVNPGSGVILLQGGHPVDFSDETFLHFS